MLDTVCHDQCEPSFFFIGIQLQYRNFGSLDGEVSVLGFGAVRLPIIGNDPSHVDEQKASALNAKRNALREYQYPNAQKRRMLGWLKNNPRFEIAIYLDICNIKCYPHPAKERKMSILAFIGRKS